MPVDQTHSFFQDWTKVTVAENLKWQKDISTLFINTQSAGVNELRATYVIEAGEEVVTISLTHHAQH